MEGRPTSAAAHLRGHLRDGCPGWPEVVVILLGRELVRGPHGRDDGPGKVNVHAILDALPHALHLAHLVHLVGRQQ